MHQGQTTSEMKSIFMGLVTRVGSVADEASRASA